MGVMGVTVVEPLIDEGESIPDGSATDPLYSDILYDGRCDILLLVPLWADNPELVRGGCCSWK